MATASGEVVKLRYQVVNAGAGTWMEECCNNVSTFRTGNNLVPEYWSFPLYTNVNNYKAYKLRLAPTSGTTLPSSTDDFKEIQFDYLKKHETQYASGGVVNDVVPTQ